MNAWSCALKNIQCVIYIKQFRKSPLPILLPPAQDQVHRLPQNQSWGGENRKRENLSNKNKTTTAQHPPEVRRRLCSCMKMTLQIIKVRFEKDTRVLLHIYADSALKWHLCMYVRLVSRSIARSFVSATAASPPPEPPDAAGRRPARTLCASLRLRTASGCPLGSPR